MEKIEMEFGKYHDVTEIAKSVSSEYKNIEKVFICPDVHTYWIARIVKGVNSEYENKDNAMILEREDIDKSKDDTIRTIAKLKNILNNATFDNYDVCDISSVEVGIEMLDGDFGIAKIHYIPA